MTIAMEDVEQQVSQIREKAGLSGDNTNAGGIAGIAQRIDSQFDRLPTEDREKLKQLTTTESKFDDDAAQLLAKVVHTCRDKAAEQLNEDLGELIVQCCYKGDTAKLRQKSQTKKLSQIYKHLKDDYQTEISRATFYSYAQTYANDAEFLKACGLDDESKELYRQITNTKRALFAMLHSVTHQEQLFEFVRAESELASSTTFTKQVSWRDIKKKKDQILKEAAELLEDTEQPVFPQRLAEVTPKALYNRQWLESEHDARPVLTSADWTGVKPEQKESLLGIASKQKGSFEKCMEAIDEKLDELRRNRAKYQQLSALFGDFITNIESSK